MTIVEYLEGLTPKELGARQNQQIAEARSAVGKAILIDLLLSGESIPPGYLLKNPGGDVEVISGQPLNQWGLDTYVLSQPYCVEDAAGIMRVDVTTCSDGIVYLVSSGVG